MEQGNQKQSTKIKGLCKNLMALIDHQGYDHNCFILFQQL